VLFATRLLSIPIATSFSVRKLVFHRVVLCLWSDHPFQLTRMITPQQQQTSKMSTNTPSHQMRLPPKGFPKKDLPGKLINIYLPISIWNSEYTRLYATKYLYNLPVLSSIPLRSHLTSMILPAADPDLVIKSSNPPIDLTIHVSLY